MKQQLTFLIAFLLAPLAIHAQVGIGTTDPKAFLHVPQGRTVLFGQDTSGIVNTLDFSYYSKLIWYGSKGAFRAGALLGNDGYSAWDNANVGLYSFASGANTRASGHFSTAMGINTNAIAQAAVSMGLFTSASGNQSVSMGDQTQASGEDAVSMGNRTQASAQAAVSMGFVTSASGPYTVSMGYSTSAIGNQSVSMGDQTQASGQAAVSMGLFTSASAQAAVSMGSSTTASSVNAVAMGSQTWASNGQATAMGNQTRASGGTSTSTGYKTIASGDYSTAMGANVSTSGKPGSFIIGDKNTDGDVYSNSANNQMMMRFGGGYILYTTNGAFSAGTAVGVQVASGGNAWSVVSDSTRKENFRAANGTDFLQKIARMRLGSWNYKGQDVRTYRHYGPMAQDFFAAFGRDELGTIGENKSINQADFDGVNLIAIQALIKEVDQLKAENSRLRQRVETVGQLQQETASLRSELDAIKRSITSQTPLTKDSAK